MVAGCGGDDERTFDARSDTPAVAPAVVVPREFGGGAPSYVTIEVTRPGRVTGTVQIAGTPPADTIVRPGSDLGVCGQAFVDTTVRRSGSRLGDVVVWLTDARAGKPVSLTRRFELQHSRCRLVPRVQAVIAGGTLNLRSRDRAVHPARFIRSEGGATVAVVTEHDGGQVIPLEHVLDHAGRLEVRCDLHPWTRAWLFVFDHPYYAVTDRGGAFVLDSIPLGRYRLMAWHERFGTLERGVVVRADSTTSVALSFESRP